MGAPDLASFAPMILVFALHLLAAFVIIAAGSRWPRDAPPDHRPPPWKGIARAAILLAPLGAFSGLWFREPGTVPGVAVVAYVLGFWPSLAVVRILVFKGLHGPHALVSSSLTTLVALTTMFALNIALWLL